MVEPPGDRSAPEACSIIHCFVVVIVYLLTGENMTTLRPAILYPYRMRMMMNHSKYSLLDECGGHVIRLSPAPASKKLRSDV